MNCTIAAGFNFTIGRLLGELTIGAGLVLLVATLIFAAILSDRARTRKHRR